jgi:hypothetical protein
LDRGLLEVVAPEIADEAEYRRLVAEEKLSRAETRLNIRDRGDGSSEILGRIPTPLAHRFNTYLDAYTSPRRHPCGDVDQLSAPRRRGEALCALLENLPVSGLPKHGGTATSVMVILDLDHLKADGGWADASTGDRMTAEQARRLACQANIIPVVLGGKGEILDLGRARRLFSAAQPKAMGLRDRQCTAEGCDIPAAWCEAHNFKKSWSKGGKQTWPTASSCARSTTTAPTAPPGAPPTTPTAPRPSTGGREPEATETGDESRSVPVYESDGETVIGEFVIQPGSAGPPPQDP